MNLALRFTLALTAGVLLAGPRPLVAQRRSPVPIPNRLIHAPRIPTANLRLRVAARPRLVGFKLVKTGKYVRGGLGSGNSLGAAAARVDSWETFQMVPRSDGMIALKCAENGRYVSVRRGIVFLPGTKDRLAASSTRIGRDELFTLKKLGNNKVALKSAKNGRYVRAAPTGVGYLTATATRIGAAETFLMVSAPKSFGLTKIVSDYSSFDLDRNGVREIEKLKYLSFEPDLPVGTNSKLVLVLVEPRLLKTVSGGPSTTQLKQRLQQFKKDLYRDGFSSRFISAQVYHGPDRQDGRTVLALRSLFQTVSRKYRNFQGVIFVGSFPEATIVRRWMWSRTDEVKIAGKTAKRWLYMVPEYVAPRADIVLADLNGGWSYCYVKTWDVDSVKAIPFESDARPGRRGEWPVARSTIRSQYYEHRKVTLKDCFFIRDDDISVSKSGSILKLKIGKTPQRNVETSAGDRAYQNTISRPEIMVSRINPLHIALKNGKRDPAVERRLLIEYFDRNHAYRYGRVPNGALRAGFVSYNLSNGSKIDMRKASPKFGRTVVNKNASLLDYVNFLRTPASLKAFSAHSNPWDSQYGKNFRVQDLERAIGTSGLKRFENGAATADFHRTLWECRTLRNVGPTLYIHYGCEVNTPAGANRGLPGRIPLSYSDSGYADKQVGESILFFLNGVGLIARAKVFYDAPAEFSTTMGRSPSTPFGEGWKANFERDAHDSALAKVYADNKRSYNWSILGDWTLRSCYR